MGLITKTNTFTGASNPELPWLDTDLDTLYTEINGNLDDANIKTNAGIAQAKVANLTTGLAAIRSDIQELQDGLAVFQAATSNARGTHTISTLDPIGIPADGDCWDVY